jgi:Domain of unknown function (DUF6443)
MNFKQKVRWQPLYVIVFLIGWSAYYVDAQTANPPLKDVVMPAPNAAALGKYGDYSVSNFTGVPDISIPIYSVQDGSLTLPITLNYHASGLKVAEMASWVGAGWSLNAGGIITRTVQGIVDEKSHGYWTDGTWLESEIRRANTDLSVNTLIAKNIADGGLDGEPDIFSFNVGGYTGKFYIDNLHNVNLIPKQDLKIEIDEDLKGFTIIAPNGTRYIFGRVLNADGTTYTTAWEQTLMQDQSSGSRYTSSWYLLRVETSDKKYRIHLAYENEAYSYLTGASVKYTYFEPAQYNSGDPYQASSNTGIDPHHKTIRTYMSGQRLIQITSTTETVQFKAANIRADLDDDRGFTDYSTTRAKSLDQIEITTGGKCQQFDFAYSYFQDSENPTPNNPSLAKKLKLESVTQKSCDGSIVNPGYAFSYNGTFLAYRLSKAIDHWGFYNGVTQNQNTRLNIPPTIWGNNRTLGTSDRETREMEMKKGVLTEIRFPTGGKTAFVYEANTISSLDQSPPITVFNLVNCPNPYNASCCGLSSGTANYTLTTEDMNTGKFKLQLTKTMGSTIGNTYTELCSGAYDITARINVYQGSSLIGTHGFAVAANQTSNVIELSPSSLNVQVGILYRFELVVTNGYSTFEIYKRPWTLVNRPVGGLRIKEIKTHDGISSANDVIKQYDYSTPTDPTVSSGRLLKFPNYLFQSNLRVNAEGGCATPVGGGGTMTTLSEESIVPLTTFEGNHIGYSHVKEIQVGNGAQLYNYYVSISAADFYSAYPKPPQEPVVHNGQLTNLSILSASGAVLKQTAHTRKEETPTYSIGKMRKAIKTSLPPDPEYQCGGLYSISYTDYQLKTLPYRLASTTETLDNVVTKTEYTYSNDATQPLFPITTSVTNSDGKVTRTTNKYVTHPDYVADPVATRLKALNIIGEPLEVTMSVENVVTSGARTQWNFFDKVTGLPTTNLTNSFPYPYQFYKYQTTWNLESTITQYDMSKGRPIKINVFGWENVTETNATEKYNWGANGLIQTRQFKDLTWHYEYEPNSRLVNKITDENGLKTKFYYDGLQRLIKTENRMKDDGTDVQAKAEYVYQYKDANNPYSFVRTTNTFANVANPLVSESYLDGLGRPVGAMKQNYTPNGLHLKSSMSYDAVGRQEKAFLPFESSTLGYQQVLGGVSFVKTEYEASPLSRPVKQINVDNSTILTSYGTNITDEVRIFVNDNGSISSNRSYAANTLYKTIMTDENGKQTVVFKDKLGRVLMTRKFLNGQNVDTYNVYDTYGQLVAVLPPGSETNGVVNNDLTFQYKYDLQNRLTEKKIPGSEPQ